jgi:ankyrin repeat protein
VIAVKNTAALKILLDAGANPNVLPLTEKVEDRVHPLVLAAKLGYMSAVRMLVEHGGAHVIESKGSFGESALHCAIQCDSDEMIAYLLGASQNKLLDKVDSTGMSY